jgi:hypothetical protein
MRTGKGQSPEELMLSASAAERQDEWNIDLDQRMHLLKLSRNSSVILSLSKDQFGRGALVEND